MDQQSVALARGARMPLIGLGTWELRGSDAVAATTAALELGYRHIDTATMYANEAEIGRALRDSAVARDDVFVTTKLPADRVGEERATIEASLEALGLDHVDLWLVHWPPAGDASPHVWDALLALRDEGLATDVGVSNYTPAQIDELVASSGEAPAVNQIPWAPSIFDAAVKDAHETRGVVLEGYSPFRRTDLSTRSIGDIAGRLGVTPAQVVLRWHVQRGIVAIPKSVRPARLAQNLDVFGFELAEADMARLDELSG
jgi:2,5-diketo-D-gluconate reductase A